MDDGAVAVGPRDGLVEGVAGEPARGVGCEDAAAAVGVTDGELDEALAGHGEFPDGEAEFFWEAREGVESCGRSGSGDGDDGG